MSTPVYVGAVSGFDISSPFSVALTLPAGSRVGDLALILVVNANNTTNPTPSGWTASAETSVGSGGYSGHVSSFYKFLTSSDISTGSVTYAHTTTSTSVAVGLVVYRHGAVAATSAVNGGDSKLTSQNVNAVGTMGTNGFFVAVAGSTDLTSEVATSYTPPSGFSELVDEDALQGAASNSCVLAVAHKAEVSGAVTAATTFTPSQATEYGTLSLRIEYDPSDNSGLQMVL